MSKVTIHDVAARAGVSIATVSRVFNNNSKVDPELVKKVTDAAIALNYRSMGITSSPSRPVKQIAFVVPSIDNTYFSTITAGAISTAQELGYQTIVMLTGSDPQEEKRCLNELASSTVSGIIFSSFNGSDPLELCPELEHIPMVIAARRHVSDKLVHVSVDNEGAGYIATKYLIRLRRTRIALFANFWDNSITSVRQFEAEAESENAGRFTAYDRYRGYRRALEEEGIEYNPELIIMSGYTYEDGYRDAQKLLGTTASFDAVVAPNDRVAAGIMRLFREQGITVPDQVSIVCLNGGLTANVVTPALTVTSQANYSLGCQAARTLIDLINGDPVENVTFDVQLMIQGSTSLK